MPTITLIGAGSTAFAKRLMSDILSFPALTDSTIVLMDIDETRLGNTARAGEILIEQGGYDAELVATTDRREALSGADYVLSMIGARSSKPRYNEGSIPEKYGVSQSIADTIGPGGVFKGLRMFPDLLEVVRDMEEVCPDAPLLNYTNPMAILCWALDEVSDIDVYGLCHSVQRTAEDIVNYTDIPGEDFEYWVAGINHMSWFLEAESDGEDVYPRLREAAGDPDIYVQDTVRFELLEHFGYFVTESSHHLSEYLPYFRKSEEMIEKFAGTGAASRMDREWTWEENDEENESETEDGQAEFPFEEDELTVERSDEYGVRIIHSIETDTLRRMNINVPNESGLITNLPTEACVEVPCLVDGRGIHPCSVGDLPPQLAALIRTNVNLQEMAVKGTIEEDRTAIKQAVKLDPLTAAQCSLEAIDDMVEELLVANADYVWRSNAEDGAS